MEKYHKRYGFLVNGDDEDFIYEKPANNWSEIQRARRLKLSPEVRRVNQRAWIIWGVEVTFCLAIGALLGWMYGRAW